MRGGVVFKGTPLTGHLPPARQAKKTAANNIDFMTMIRDASTYNRYEELQTLRKAGASAKELADEGCSISALQAAGYGPRELATAFSPTQLKSVGIVISSDPNQAVIAPPPSSPPPPPPPLPREKLLSLEEALMRRMEKMGMNMQKLQEAQFTASELKDIAGLSDASLKKLGYEADTTPHMSLKGQNETMIQFAQKARASKVFPPNQLRKMGLTASQLTTANYTLPELRRAGYGAADLKQAQYSLEQLKAAGFSAKSLLAAGYNINELKKAGYSMANILSGTNLSQISANGLDALRAARFGALTNPQVVGVANAARAATLAGNPTALAASSTNRASLKTASTPAATANAEVYNPKRFSFDENPRPYQSETPSATASEMIENPTPHPPQ